MPGRTLPLTFRISTSVTAQACGILVEQLGIDGELTEVYGLVHDIGRRYGVTKARHSLDGYRFLIREG